MVILRYICILEEELFDWKWLRFYNVLIIVVYMYVLKELCNCIGVFFFKSIFYVYDIVIFL